VSILETVLIFVGIPVLVIAVLGLMTITVRRSPNALPAEYRLGERWTYGPVLWSATDEATTHSHHSAHAAAGADLIGGSASGKW
jgi:hypothetical protein